MTAILRDASGKMHHGILFDPPLDQGHQGVGLRFPCNDRTDEVNF